MAQGTLKKAPAKSKAPSHHRGGLTKKGKKFIQPKDKNLAKSHAQKKKLAAAIHRDVEGEIASKADGTGKLTILAPVAEAAKKEQAKEKQKKEKK